MFVANIILITCWEEIFFAINYKSSNVQNHLAFFSLALSFALSRSHSLALSTKNYLISKLYSFFCFFFFDVFFSLTHFSHRFSIIARWLETSFRGSFGKKIMRKWKIVVEKINSARGQHQTFYTQRSLAETKLTWPVPYQGTMLSGFPFFFWIL